MAYFRDNDPTFWNAFTPALAVAAVVFVRSPLSNYIFDEQEALLANPYVNGKDLAFWQVLERDFWGLPPTRSIGSYRPLPNVIWRAIWSVHENPWLLHWVNVVVHAANAALLAGFARRLTGQRGVAWLVGAAFLLTAVVTEAVTGVVGLADVLSGLGVLLALGALGLPLWAMPFAVFAASAVGFASKESVVVAVPLVPWAAFVSAGALHPSRPLRLVRAGLAALAVVAALVGYTYLRRAMFPVSLPDSLLAPLPADEPAASRALHEFLRWFQQPKLPQDPVNNPLVSADFPHRVAGALRVFASGLGQVLFPWTLAGDYSFRQEPVPERLVFPGSVIGGAAMLLAPLAGVAAWAFGTWRDRRSSSGSARSALAIAIGLVWFPVAYFPHSNIPTLLPTVRAERFWYLPAMGTALVLGVILAALARVGTTGRTVWGRRGAVAVVGAFLCFQAARARLHALDYSDDLAFWGATASASPNSAKAHLNYGVMLGARGRLGERLTENARAIELAPEWPMAHVYYGDTLCRMQRPEEAWPHYLRGFAMAPNDQNLIALALQCLWDQKGLEAGREDLVALADEHPGSWLAWLANDTLTNGATHGGVDPRYRPRGYDEGPKQ